MSQGKAIHEALRPGGVGIRHQSDSMGRAMAIHAAVTKALDDHYRTLNDDKTRLRTVRVVVRMAEDGRTPDQVNVAPEFELKM